jgi:CBS domain-containing protein
MVGVISKADIVREISHCLEHACTAAVSSVTTRNVVACRPQDWLIDVWSKMMARALQCVPVVDTRAKPLGIIYA